MIPVTSLEISRNLPVYELLQPYKTISRKAERSGCWIKREGTKNSRNSNYQFWRQDNQPKECYSEQFTDQKLDYIHNNPVEAGIVDKAEEYLYSETVAK